MMESTASKRIWHSGPPPHIGWWNASLWGDHDLWRWWDGQRWSWGVNSSDPINVVRLQASKRLGYDVKWSDYYPENARVPRVDPRSVDVRIPMEPVQHDLLPPVGSQVLIHLARQDKWVEHTVVGYYVWGNLREDKGVHRVFVRVRDAQGYLNARLLNDVRPVPDGPR
jgi:hypothetical protein